MALLSMKSVSWAKTIKRRQSHLIFVGGIGVLSEKEKKKLLECASGLDRIILLLLFETGLEIDDLIGLKTSDVDFQKETMLIRNSGEEKRVSSGTMAEIRSYLGGRPGQVYLLEGRCGKPITAKWKRCVLDRISPCKAS
jgi:integrase